MIRQIVVLAGGLATRLHPITKKIPKSMVPVAGEPFLAHQLRIFRQNDIEEAVVCVGHLADQIIDYFGDGKKFGVRLTYSREKERLDTGGAIKLTLPYLDDRFFTIYGDSYLDYDYQKVIDFYQTHNRLGLMTVWKNNNRIEPSRILVERQYVKKYQKDPAPKGARFAEYGLNILPKKIIKQIPEASFPISRYFDLLSPKKQLLAYQVPEQFYEIGSPNGLLELGKLISQQS